MSFRKMACSDFDLSVVCRGAVESTLVGIPRAGPERSSPDSPFNSPQLKSSESEIVISEILSSSHVSKISFLFGLVIISVVTFHLKGLPRYAIL